MQRILSLFLYEETKTKVKKRRGVEGARQYLLCAFAFHFPLLPKSKSLFVCLCVQVLFDSSLVPSLLLSLYKERGPLRGSDREREREKQSLSFILQTRGASRRPRSFR